MKQIEIALCNLNKEDIKKLTKDDQILEYDSLKRKCSIIKAGEDSPALKNKNDHCHYFSFEEVRSDDK